MPEAMLSLIRDKKGRLDGCQKLTLMIIKPDWVGCSHSGERPA